MLWYQKRSIIIFNSFTPIYFLYRPIQHARLKMAAHLEELHELGRGPAEPVEGAEQLGEGVDVRRVEAQDLRVAVKDEPVNDTTASGYKTGDRLTFVIPCDPA